MHPKTLTTPERYGAGIAHTVASIGHVLSCFYCGLLWITMDYRLSWTSGLLRHIVDYCGFLDMHHHEIAWIAVYARQASEDT